MTEIVISIGAKVAEYLVTPILRRASYLFCFKKFIGDVEKEKEELKVKLADVKKRQEEAERKTEEIMPSVKKWLDDVNVVLEDVQKLQREIEGGGKSCFNVSLRYSLAKKMDNKAKLMMKHKNNSDLDPFSCPTQLPGINYFSSKGFVDFDSRKSTYNRLLEAVRDAKNKLVGLYGMAGSGKTTLAKEVGRKMEDKVIMVVVSKPPNIFNIQQEIAEQIGLNPFTETTQLDRAQRLSMALKNKRTLIILDDVWSKLSLEEIGIQVNEGCRVLITTRIRNVCFSMDCEIDNIIELHLLTQEEAWALFKVCSNTANIPMDEFDRIGRKIVDECKGLPIAIVTVGSTLKGKSIQEWRTTLLRLQCPPPLDIDDDLKAPYAILEVSYDNLPSPLAKSLFLLCSMFPEDHEIHTEDLIRFGKGTLELGGNIYTMEDARIVVLATIQKLLDSCLLMHTDEQACVKMHDLVRDVGIWIAKKQGQAILEDNRAVSNIVALNDTKTMSLWNLDENFKLSNQLCFPTLEILLLQPHGSIEDLGAMKTLKVLALITNGFGWHIYLWPSRTFCSIPRSIISTNLHTLCLREKILGDISFLSELKGLETLDLHGSQFDELPAGIVDMKMLKLLDIFNCKIEKSPLEVLARCEQLGELYFWDKKSAVLEIFSHSMLKRYVIYDSTCSSVSRNYIPFMEYFDSCDEALRALCIKGFKVYALGPLMKDLIRRANILWLENCRWDHKDINFEIKHLGVSRCQEKRFIIENLDVNIHQIQQVFSHLISLRLIEMESLEQVFQDSSISFSLPMLQDMLIERCPELRTIFNHDMIKSLQKLRKLEIVDCNKVKCLFSYSLASHCPSLEELKISDCSEFERLVDEKAANVDPLHDHQYFTLQTERSFVGVTASSTVCFPKLHRIEIFCCDKVRSLLSYSLASHCPSLKNLRIKGCSELERLVDEGGDDMGDNPNTDRVFVGITAKSFNQLSGQQTLIIFLSLKVLKMVSSGKNNKGIFKVQVEGEELITAQEPLRLNSKLRKLYLEDLTELEYIWKSPTQIVSLHKLGEVVLVNCPKLKIIFILVTVSSFPQLKRLKVMECKEWEGIFCEESLENLSSSYSSNVCFPKLHEIDISYCKKVRRVFSYSLASHCPSLKELTIEGCSQLEGVVKAYEGEVVGHHDEKLFPMLNYLRLRRLPELRKIYPNYELIHIFGNIDIEDCPNIP